MRPRHSWPLLAFAFACALGVAAFFYAPARSATAGDWPAPLDDVFIHFDFARALAQGHPFEWIPGQGYASGETSPAYAALLAVGYLVGFHGLRLGVFAALVAIGSFVYVAHALRELVRPAPSWVAGLGAVTLLSMGTLDFAWWSGMEVALFGATAAALLLRVKRARDATPTDRARRQWEAGLAGGILVLVRPEAAVIVAVAMVVVARRAEASSASLACMRTGLPGAVATLSVLLLNYWGTGYAASAGALLKLLSSNPFSTDVDRAKDFVVNIASFVQRTRHDLGASHVGLLALILPGLALASLTSRRTRGLGALCLAGALLFALLVSWNGTARFQNFRYYMPALTLAVYATTLGLAACATRRWSTVASGAAATLGILVAARQVPEAARFFTRASENIHDQQVEVGRRLARSTAKDAIILVGDAGAIPYVSGRHAVDAFGLGGTRGIPFVRAAVQGEAATIELIERMPPRERPTVMALFPNWFPGLTRAFGHETGRVTLTDNVICGGATKGIYDADWSALLQDDLPAERADEPGVGAVLDEIDVADVVSEEAHGYVSPAPEGGWTVFDIHDNGFGDRRFDGGRIIPAAREESFTLVHPVPSGSELVARTDGKPSEVLVSWMRRGTVLSTASLEAVSAGPGRWGLSRSPVTTALQPGDRGVLRVTAGELRDFHLWLAAPPAPPLSARP